MRSRMLNARILVLIVLFSLFFAGYSMASDEKRIAAVIKDFPPFYQTAADGKPEGFAIDILTAVAREAKLEIDYLPVKNWAEAIQELRDGHADLIPGIGISPEKETEFIFSIHIETIPVCWFVRKESSHIQTAEDLKGLKIAVINKGVASDYLNSDPDYKLRHYDTLEEALFGLLSGNADAFAIPKPVLEKKAREIGLENRIRVVGQPLLELKRSYMYRAGDEMLRDRLEPYLKKFITSKEYLRAYHKWYGAPVPFWTTAKVFWAMTLFFALVVIIMLLSRYAAFRQLRIRIEESEERLRLTTDNLPNGYVYQYTYEADGKPRFTFVSKGVERVHPGVTVDAVLKDAGVLHSLIDADQIPALMAAESASAENLSDFSMDLRFHLPSGELRWFHAYSRTRRNQGGQVFWDGAVVDISDRKRMEDALSEEKARLSALSSNLADSMVYQIDSGSDGKSRRFSYLSPAVEKFHGVSVEAAMKDPGLIYGQVLPEDIEGVVNDETKAFEAKVKFESDVRVRIPSGDIRWRRFISSPRLTDEGNWLWDGIEVDITEKKNLRDQLNQAQKMESIGRLAGGVAHDFNNMLGVILGHAELGMSETGPDHPVWADLSEIKKAAEHSANLTRQLLAFARKQTAAPRILDLNETIEGMLKMLRRLIGEDIDLIWAPGSQAGLVNMDPSQVDQILANLCVNARDAIPDTGIITIRTSRTVLDETFCKDYPECFPGDYILLTVSDTGTGMDREVLEKIFEPFFTTKDVGKGTGLGLATVYGIIKQNNGLILADSTPGQGSSFRIYLPLVESSSPDQKESRVTDTPKGGHETILLTEDDPSILAMAEKMMTKLGYKVLAASMPDEAIRLAKAYIHNIDLLITDVIMPEMNGRDLAETLSSHFPDLKILFMSGYTSDVIAHHGVLGKGVCFIQKPFRIRELAIKVREVLDQGITT